MSCDETIAAAAIVLFDDSDEDERSKQRRWWVGPICESRDEQGAMSTTVPRLLHDGTRRVGTFVHYFRMPEELFDKLVTNLEPLIRKEDTNMRAAVDVKTRLGVTLRYLATGASMSNLHYEFKLGVKTISNIIHETCAAINIVLKDYVKMPQNAEEWTKVADNYLAKWNYPNCIGSLDGKHIRIIKPHGAGSEYHNYKGFESVVLMAIADADQRFIYVHIGSNGRNSDAGIWRECELRQLLENDGLNLPTPRKLPCTEDVVPFHFISDEAFPLKSYMMKPYARGDRNLSHDKLVFNYRLSRARRIVENAFGRLVAMWQIFQRPINIQPERVDSLVMACCSLQNYLLSHNAVQFTIDTDAYIQNGTWRAEIQSELRPLPRRTTGNNPAREAKHMQQVLNNWFSGVGAVEWQDRMVIQGQGQNQM